MSVKYKTIKNKVILKTVKTNKQNVSVKCLFFCLPNFVALLVHKQFFINFQWAQNKDILCRRTLPDRDKICMSEIILWYNKMKSQKNQPADRKVSKTLEAVGTWIAPWTRLWCLTSKQAKGINNFQINNN